MSYHLLEDSILSIPSCTPPPEESVLASSHYATAQSSLDPISCLPSPTLTEVISEQALSDTTTLKGYEEVIKQPEEWFQ